MSYFRAKQANGTIVKVPVGGSAKGAVRYDQAQALTDAQKSQTRSNIGTISDNITLGIHSDGLVYIFVDGQPMGEGISMSAASEIYGYVADDGTIVVKGDLADGEYTVKYEIDNEDGTVTTIDIGDLVLDNTVYYSITKDLTNCTLSNSATQVAKGENYSATITANDGYELTSVVVTMGGSAVGVSSGVIGIPSVTGDIVIEAVAIESTTAELTNFFDANGEGALVGRIGSAAAGANYTASNRTDSPNSYVSNFIKVQKEDVLAIKGCVITGGKQFIGIYNDNTNRTVVNSALSTTSTDYYDLSTIGTKSYEVTIKEPADGYLFRFTFASGTSGVAVNPSDIVINIKRNGEWLTDEVVVEPSYTNLLPLSVDENGNDFKGQDAKGGDGYEYGYKLSGSSANGTPSATSGAYVSGFIPITDQYDVVRIKNITLYQGTSVNNIIFYDTSKAKLYAATGNTGNCFNSYVTESNGVYSFKPSVWDAMPNIGFFRFSCGGISDDTIVTINEEIV